MALFGNKKNDNGFDNFNLICNKLYRQLLLNEPLLLNENEYKFYQLYTVENTLENTLEIEINFDNGNLQYHRESKLLKQKNIFFLGNIINKNNC